MPIYRDKARGCYVFEFDRRIEGRRVRARKVLPKTWTSAQADAYDRKESSRLYAIASRVQKPTHSIEDAVTLYLKERAPTLKSGDNVMGELAQMYWAFKDRPITELADVCREYTEKGTKTDGSALSPATLRNRLRYLISACRHGWKHHGMCDHDPAQRVILPTVRNERRHFIDRKQMLALCKVCHHKPTRAAIRIAFYSGMRLSEIKNAVRRGGEFILSDTKNGLPRHVPVHPKVRCCIHIAMPDVSRISKHFRDARRSIDMDWLHFHDLRHSAASEMINAGVDLYTVGAVLGHKSASSTKRYAHLANESIRDALTQIGRKKSA